MDVTACVVTLGVISPLTASNEKTTTIKIALAKNIVMIRRGLVVVVVFSSESDPFFGPIDRKPGDGFLWR